MRMIHVTGDSKWGGGAGIIFALAETAMEMGWGVDFLTTDPVCQAQGRARGLRIVDLDAIRRQINPLRDLRGLVSLYHYFKRSQYGLVHTHTSKAGFLGRIAARMAGVPAIVHTAHAFSFHEESSFAERNAYVLLEKIAARFCDRIVTVSEYHRDWGMRLGIAPPSRMLAIPNGLRRERVEASLPTAAIRAQWNLAPEEIAILVAGRLADGKGLEYLIEAVLRLQHRDIRRFRVLLAGEGPLRAALERRVHELRLADRIQFLGFCTEIGSLLNACDLVVMPSLHEGCSISLLEAMAAGKPIIASAIGSNLEVTSDGQGAFLVPPKNAAALAETIERLIENPSQAVEKARAARAIYESRYTIERMTNAYRSLYERLTVGARSTAPALAKETVEENIG